MARASAKVELLRNVPLFSGLSAKELMSLSRLMDEIDLKPGTVIIREGNTGGEFFIVLEGTIEVKRKGRRLARLGPGDYLGEIALIDHGPRTATAMVETGCPAPGARIARVPLDAGLGSADREQDPADAGRAGARHEPDDPALTGSLTAPGSAPAGR